MRPNTPISPSNLEQAPSTDSESSLITEPLQLTTQARDVELNEAPPGNDAPLLTPVPLVWKLIWLLVLVPNIWYAIAMIVTNWEHGFGAMLFILIVAFAFMPYIFIPDLILISICIASMIHFANIRRQEKQEL